MRSISRTQFNAFCYARQPLIRFTAVEVAWFEIFDRKILGLILFDRTDGDFGYLILGRDTRKMFRCIEVSKEFRETPEQAITDLSEAAKKYENDGQEVYPQGDEKVAPYEILEPVVAADKLHPYFKILISEPRYEAARNLIREMVYSYKDPDGHYIKEFQTHGFDARLWELYLYVYLYEEGFEFVRGKPAPDFHLNRFGENCLIEAVTVNPSQDSKRPDASEPKTHEEVMDLSNNYLPIKFGSPLFSKLKKKYWELPHAAGKPLVFAIHDYHMPGSMMWSRTALSEFLYGVRNRLKKDAQGNDVAAAELIESHTWGEKTIPSRFFDYPESENVSAVLFSNAATIPKFNRMGKLAGLGSKDVIMIRKGFRYNPDPQALRPLPFAHNVDDPDYEESWADSIVMYHNPKASFPIDPAWFPSITHIWQDLETGEFKGIQQPYNVLSSATIVLTTHE